MISTDPERAWEQALREGAEELSCPLSEAALDAYRHHYRLLLAHNARAGLTSLSDPVEIALKHYLDSLSVLLLADPAPGQTVADLGSGAGFPGLVLAVVRPEAHYTLIESSAKRSDFLRLAVQELSLTQVTVITARAEDAGRELAYRDHFDLVLARALAALPVLLELGLPLARVGGRLLAMKGPEGEAEVAASAQALEVLGGRVEAVHTLSLPQGVGQRTLVLVEKTAPTPARYPRRAGIPAKRPL